MKYLAALSLLALTGCSSTNVSELMKALAADPNANCVMVGTVYGTLTVARGTPQASVNVAAGTCTITGAGVTTVTVPQPNVTVTPSPLLLKP